MSDDRLALARQLKQTLLDYVLDAEDDIAIALETYTAQELKRLSTSAFKGSDRTEFVLDQFLTAQPPTTAIAPIAAYLSDRPSVSAPEKTLLALWHRAFVGLFQIDTCSDNSFTATNGLTQKSYSIFYSQPEVPPALARLKPGDMIQSRILPLSDTAWMLSGPTLNLGALGDKKLAVAIGSFRQHHPDDLYADAPELSEEAWKSVETAHHSFSDFFGGEQVTLSGEALHRQLKAYQSWLTQRELDHSDIDGSKSLATLAREAGISDEDMADRLSLLGVEASASKALIEKQSLAEMIRPPLELPRELRSSPKVTVLSDIRGGQIVLPDYHELLELLASQEPLPPDHSPAKILDFFSNPSYQPFLWYSLAKTHPTQLEQAIRGALQQPQWSLARDLDPLLLTYHDRLDPPLPETASVPMHLHTLFQRALTQLKPSSKSKKGKKKVKSGFG